MRTVIPMLLLAAAGLVAQTQRPKPQPPPDVVVQSDIEYSNVGGRMQMDVVMPRSGDGPFPAVVCIHGGGFRAGTRQAFLPIAYYLAQRGYVAATVTYRLSPMAQFPAPVEDVKAAVRFLRANAGRFHLDPDRIGATGGSAGGHLALMLGLTGGVEEFEGSGLNQDVSSRVQSVVNFYGPTDFTASYEPGKSVDAAEVLPMFLGGALEHNRAEHIRASPLNWVTPDDAPTLTLHGSKDNYVAHEHGVWLTERLEAAGVVAELDTIEGAGHGFKGADQERAYAAMAAWFDKTLAPKPEPRLLFVADHGPNGQIVAMDWPSGRELWTVPNNRGHDVQHLSNGHILYTTGSWGRVIEMDAHGREVWSYGEGLKHPIAAQRLDNGHTVIGDMELAKVFEIDTDGKVVWTYENPELGQRQMRGVRRTPEGTTLISVERLNKVIEVDRSGKIVWTFQATGGDERFPYQAYRLANGNTLIGMAAPGQVVEVAKDGTVVRSVGGLDNAVRMGWCSGLQPLPDGGFFVSDYTGRRLLEFDRDWKLAHQHRLGSRTVASVSMLP
ncbi:MAG: alpha/beta hydrolase fold domain-containing protein [Acidobacteria bacterium]|nr:alpha/beta hydrolase fold domain-containing protein [Acidobacteriota bacterium]